jgi:predicted nucleic acid-binding protein
VSLAVVDASAMAAVVFKEPEGADVAERLRSHFLVAPRLMAYELANTAVLKIKAHPDSAGWIMKALTRALADDFAITWSDVEYEEVADLAVRTGLTAYDASYLWLARHMHADLVTLDKTLAKAATARIKRQ